MTENWVLHKKEGNINAENEFIRQIIERLGKDVSESFYSLKSPITKPGERTTKLFEVLTLMGDEKGYKVYSHSLSENFMKEHKNEKGEPKFVNREWLYDLLWYTEDNNEGYCPIDFPLIVESEWGKRRKEDKNGDPYSGIKYDFQKLLLSNTGLKLMVFNISRGEDLNDLHKYFYEAIAKYTPLKEGIFLFIAFCNKEKSFYYWYKEKQTCNRNSGDHICI
ncbi:hypothetical protein [Porphyromonas endodontalis]